jgi:ubiquinone/menaquinone biosynthesis C-methylase UbiE
LTKTEITSEKNKAVYNSENVVSQFVTLGDLQKPEKKILNEFKNKLPNMKMLDVGVGAGRTTIHFAYLAKEYSGIDCSKNMIRECHKKFQNYPKKISFMTEDARNMTLFKDNYFDFVLFSWCGIDYVAHEDRQKILSEIRRVIKKGGYFCFQTHNMNYEMENCSIRFSKNPYQLAWIISRLLQLRLLNGSEVWKIIRTPSRKQQHILFHDETHDFRLKTYVITPMGQIEQLNQFGFACTRVFGWDGTEIKDINSAKDGWLYFLSKAI